MALLRKTLGSATGGDSTRFARPLAWAEQFVCDPERGANKLLLFELLRYCLASEMYAFGVLLNLSPAFTINITKQIYWRLYFLSRYFSMASLEEYHMPSTPIVASSLPRVAAWRNIV